jgi:hypothetical protein
MTFASLDEYQTATTHPLDARTETELNRTVKHVKRFFSIRVQMRRNAFAREANEFDDRKVSCRFFLVSLNLTAAVAVGVHDVFRQ